MRADRAIALAFACAFGVFACTESRGVQVGVRRQAVELDQLGAYYDVAFAPAPSLAMLRTKFSSASDSEITARFARELAVQGEPYWSSAAITIPALDGPGGAPVPPPAPATGVIRFSCGATLISPSYVMTAGHCVDPSREDMTNLRLHMYRPTPGLVASYTTATEVSGSWPLFTHATLSEADGYLSDEYPCQLVRRCWNSVDLDCPDTNSDAALLLCAGRPGDRYGFLNVNVGDPTGKEALMQWKHEVIRVPSPAPQEFIDHYVNYPTSPEQNYHYFDNQLLPLRSIAWSDGTPTGFLDSTWTDLHGCHGSSGSGMLARAGTTPVFALVAPVSIGGAAFGNFLCEHVPNPGGSASGQATDSMATAWPDPTTWLAGDAAAMQADCRDRAAAARDVDDLPFSVGSHHVSTLFSHLDCQVDGFAHDGTITADAALGPYPEKYIDQDAAAAERVIHGFSVEAGAAYRLAVHAVPLAACASNCGAINIRIDADTAATAAPTGSDAAVITRLFSASSTGAVEIGLSTAGTRRALGAFVLLREGQVNSFDILEDRLDAALYGLAGAAPAIGPEPMRFVGDGKAGFAALLYPAERMALLRQAIAPGQRWTVRIGADSYDDLYCGLLDAHGAPVGRTRCAARLSIDDTAGTAGRLGFYVELDPASARSSTTLRYIALASGAAPDADGDGIADVLDSCPGDSHVHCGEPDYDAGRPPIGDDTDAGGPEDAVADAGVSSHPKPHDTSQRDAGARRDAGAVTAGSGGVGSSSDAAVGSEGRPVSSDAGGAAGDTHSNDRAAAMSGSGEDARGCGCRIGPAPVRARGGALPVLLASLLAAARRRARRRRAR